MASRGMTLNAVIKLTATQFNAGIKQVQRSLNSLVSSFKQAAGIIAGGIGFGYILREIKDTATQLSIAKATLENVAENGTKYGKNVENGVKDVAKANAEYASNMEFLKRISNEYGQSLLGLTQSFAKFRSAAGYAGVSLTEIKRIYEALTKAAGAYHLTQEQTANAMLAVEQMFSKGKVTSEELRRQLGNALPGAFGIMAKAAYKAGAIVEDTTGAFESAMKAGKILAKDVMPAFADELNRVTEGANFDSLQSSLNRFSNAWTEFTEKTNFEGIFKKLVDGGAKALNFLGKNLKQVLQTTIAAISGIAGGKIFSKLEKEGTKSLKVVQKEYDKLQSQAVQLTGKQEQYTRALEATEALSKRWSTSYINVNGITEAEARLAGLDQKLIETAKAEGKLGTTTIKTSQAQIIYSQRLKDVQKQLDANKASMAGYESKMKMSTTAIGRAFMGLKTVGTAAMSALNTALTSIGIGILISVLTQALAKLMDILSFSNKLKKEVEQINKEAHAVGSEVESQIAEANTLAGIVRDTSVAEDKRKGALKKLNELLGLSGEKALTLKSTANDINTAIGKWSDNITKAAVRMSMLTKIGYIATREIEIDLEIKENQEKIDNKHIFSGIFQGRIERLKKEKAELEKLKGELEAEAKSITEELAGTFNDEDTGGSGGGSGSSSTDKLKKAVDDYKESLKELQNQEKNGAITKEEYFEEEGKLAEKTWKTIAAFDEYDKKLKALGGDYADLGELIKEVGTLYAGHKERAKLIEEERKKAKELDEQYQKIKEKFDELTGEKPTRGSRNTFFDYKKSPKDKMDEEADLSESYLKDLENLRDKLEDLKKDAKESWTDNMQQELDALIQKIGVAADEAKTIREQANFAELAEDIKQMQKELDKTRFDNISNVADSFHSLGESVMNCAKAMDELSGAEGSVIDDETLKKYQAFMTILDEIIQMINTVNSLIKMFSEYSEQNAKLQQAYAQQEMVFEQQKMATKQTEAVVAQETAAVVQGSEKVKQVAMQGTMQTEMQSVGTTLTAESQKQGSIAATTSAEATGAVVGGMKSVASVPYVGPILAAAAAATITALIMAAMSKFAKGGIVGGNSTTGDKNVIRANSGEMILNKSQQGRLWNMLNGKEGTGVGNVQFKIRGTDLIGVMNNEMSKRRG